MLTRAVLAVALAATSLLSTELAAQRPQTRQGFWIGFGFGGGNLSWRCDGCPDQDHGGPTAYLRLGGTPSDKILLGAEINGWALDIGAADISAGYTAFTVYWYPNVRGGVFVKGGVGAGAYRRTTATQEATSTGGAFLLGAGYDWRVGRKISITPMLTLWSSSSADLKDGTTTLETSFRHGGATLQLGITFH